MPLSKRRRLFTPKKNGKLKPTSKECEEQNADNEVSTARGRLKGALLEMMEPAAEESDASSDYGPAKRERRRSSPKLMHWYQRPHRRNISAQEQKEQSSEDEEKSEDHRKSPQRQSYVLKLFDRSVDLSQFTEDSPLYPICRAWIANQPKANYRDFNKVPEEEPSLEPTVELPGPEGPVVSRIPSLLPEQKACNKDNINLNYLEAPPPSREQLLQQHMCRWAGVRGAWLQQAALVEARYSATRAVLEQITNSQL